MPANIHKTARTGIALLLLLLALCGAAQLPLYNQAVIWRGFNHQWTYNHRCNRMGDYVVYNNGTPQSYHTSATGFGPDSTYFTSHYSLISTPDIAFKEGVASIRIDSKEKQLSEGTIEVSLPCDSFMRHCDTYLTLLNGFDLHSEEAADKIQLMRLSIDNARLDTLTNTLHFTINLSLVMNCQSFECEAGSRKVNYDLSVYYLIAATQHGAAAFSEKFITRSYSWDKKEELNERPAPVSITGSVANAYSRATVGIKAVSIVLNAAHWLLQFNNIVEPMHYRPAQAELTSKAELLFKEWQEGMRQSNASPSMSRLAEKRKGWVLLDETLVMIQCRQADIRHLHRQGQLFWRGGNRSAMGRESINQQAIGLE